MDEKTITEAFEIWLNEMFPMVTDTQLVAYTKQHMAQAFRSGLLWQKQIESLVTSEEKRSYE